MAPAAPPADYPGAYYLSIGGGNFIELESFGGCFEKELGVEYEDCYFSTERFLGDVLDWLNDTTNGLNTNRALTVVQRSQSLPANIIATMTLSGFMREFRLSPVSTAGKSHMTASFIVVPSGISTNYNAGGPLPSVAPPSYLFPNLFNLTVEGTTLAPIVTLDGLGLAWQKVLVGQVGTRNVYGLPVGAPDSYDITITATRNGAAGQYLETWFTAAATGGEPSRSGAIDFTNGSAGAVLRTVVLNGLRPKQFLPFTTSTGLGNSLLRTITISTTGFHIQ